MEVESSAVKYPDQPLFMGVKQITGAINCSRFKQPEG